MSGNRAAGTEGREWGRWFPVLILVAVVVAYARVWGFAFLNYDDNLNVYENPLLNNLTPANLLRFWQKPYEGLYIPLTYTVWALLVKISSLTRAGNGGLFDPTVFHGANLIIHGVNAVLLFFLLRLLVRRDWPALAGALLFALHPLQVEAVSWVTGFKAVLCGFFSLVSLWLYTLHGTQDRDRGSDRRPWSAAYPAAAISFLAAMLTMPTAVVVPVAAGIIAVLPLGRPWRRVGLELVPWLILVIPVVLVTKMSQPDAAQGFLPSFGQRFLIAGDAVSFYLGKLLLPIRLGPDYGRTPELALSQTPWIYATALLPYLLAAAMLWRCRNVWLWAATGIFIVVLGPVLGFLTFSFQDMSTVADRYCYLAMIGPALLVAWLPVRWPGRMAATLCTACLAALAVVSFFQTRHWRDSFTLDTYTLALNPRSWMALHNLGLWYLDHEQLDTAVAHYERALALKPNSFKAYNNLGMIYDRMGEKEKAIAAYKQALAIQPNYALVCNNIAVIYKGLNRFDEAIEYYRRALAINPEFAEVYANLGNLYRVLGNPEEAAENYRQALALRPNNAELANDLGLLYAEEKRPAEAIPFYRQALQIKPRFAEAHANLGVAYKLLGQTEEAIAAFRQAILLNPDLVDAYINLGVLLADSSNETEALQMYERAALLRPDYEIPPYALGTLYHALGRDGEALEALQRAVAIKPDFGPAYNALANLYLAAKEYGPAVEFAERAEVLGFADQALLDALAPYRKR